MAWSRDYFIKLSATVPLIDLNLRSDCRKASYARYEPRAAAGRRHSSESGCELTVAGAVALCGGAFRIAQEPDARVSERWSSGRCC
jgi:hypothetical protein